MVRTSQCFRTKPPQLDGPPTLAAAEGIPYTLILPASLLKPERGCSPLDFSCRHKWHSLASSFSLRVHESVNRNSGIHPREEVGGTFGDRQSSSGARHPGG